VQPVREGVDGHVFAARKFAIEPIKGGDLHVFERGGRHGAPQSLGASHPAGKRKTSPAGEVHRGFFE
jgi:hypothetical protein